MKLNIIHLPHRIDRMDTFKQELALQGITDYQIWGGILDREKPMRGISKAHKQIVRNAKENRLPEVLIAEDDLRFTDKGAFSYFLHNKPPDFDIYLGGIYHGQVGVGNTVNDFSGLTMYIVKEKFYDTFLSIPEDKHIDRGLKDRGHYLACDPFVVFQYNGFSDNTNTEVNYDHFLVIHRFYRQDGKF